MACSAILHGRSLTDLIPVIDSGLAQHWRSYLFI